MFETLPLLPSDPILGLIESLLNDSNPNKVDLGVGVYKNEQGETPVLESVKRAERYILEHEQTKRYISPTGASAFNIAIQNLLLGHHHSVITEQRIATIQTPGGCGALRIAAELVKKSMPTATIWVSNPTWGNHTPLLGVTGLQIKTYPYYDALNHQVSFEAMLNALQQTKKGDLVLLHGCCHNPSGADLSPAQWQALVIMASKKGFTPFIDMAYQGFGIGIEEDAYGVRLLAEQLPELLVAYSCSKNFGVYRERVGAVIVVANNTREANTCNSQLATIIRGIYSMPPSHGAAIVAHILTNDELHQHWLGELDTMRNRINSLRKKLLDQLTSKGANSDFSFICTQNGMFSFLDITPKKVQRLREDFSIYMTTDSRINIAGINNHNIDYLSSAIVSVL